ncbi:beta-propeller fold lactonase family protein [Cognatiyoonia sp. IB215182]|uniref:beta-propeller fold lactonase family protein n=1 Tax=Cognatiyoonia sp. IB215182 TaxID=3097353 RepID=UPI002A0B5B20|nr:beta-propeller fold lactonase family protein [Cognatiyoonia sp. IB215182]MDX8350872.1 beta-propeller fold lactonase family protein [Cognatiyoonia sp. IB215182]
MRPNLSLALATLIPTAAFAEPTARYVIALSDVDMAGTAYEDDQLGAPLDAVDTMSIFTTGAPETALAKLNVSNSVAGPPMVLDISPDGTRAIVAETLRPREPEDTTLTELSGRPGETLRLYDLSDPTAPALVNEARVPVNPQAARLNAAGDLIAVVGFGTDNGLTLIPLSADGLGEAVTFDLGLVARADLPFDPAHSVQFHPTEDIVAVNLTIRNQIAFYRIDRAEDGAPTGIEPWGNLVSTNKFPFVGAFTPDGRHYVTSELMWGPDVERFYGSSAGTVTSIRVADPGDAEPRHAIQSIVPGGYQGETLAIGPDGDRVAILSLRNTGLTQDDPRFDPQASLSLYALDGETGGLSLVEEEMFEAHLPQGLAFDPSGTALYVGVNEYFDATDPVMRGAVELWTVEVGGVTRTNTRMPAPRGVHGVAVIE